MKDLPQRLVDRPRRPSRQSLTPRAELRHVQTVDTHVGEPAGAVQRGTLSPVPQPSAQRAERVRLRVVLGQVLVDALGERRHRAAPDRGDIAVAERLDRGKLELSHSPASLFVAKPPRSRRALFSS
ncbi:MAG TPA: hypothetical protein VNO56_02850 [Gaiellaceae bacterium]|nr:hypothetical protein [Gaiellaceae bacterium]